MKPVIKWAGGKTQLLDKLLPLVPEKIERYYEPFVGGGALFFALNPERAILNDFNPQLINLYKQIRYNLEKLKEELNKLKEEHSEENYYEVRKAFNECLEKKEESVKSAAYMLYLNKAGFNGLYRLNSSGKFNVPSAHRKTVNLYDEDNLDEISEKLKNVCLRVGDFEKACEDADKGDFVFFDSPYYNTFDTYQAGGFSEDDHKRLAKLFKTLTDRGVKCLLTNSNEQFIKDLYKDYNIEVVQVKRMVNSDAKNRVGEEVIIKNY